MAIALAAVVELACGLAILTGFKTRIVAWVLFLYLIPVTFFFHNFWAAQGQEQQTQMINFLKNAAIMGGLLVLAVNGAGSLFGGCREWRRKVKAIAAPRRIV